jgi:LPS-assembly lipoprotein
MPARRHLLMLGLTLPALLADCGGWEPLYANRDSGPTDERLRAIKVPPIAERVGQRLALGLRNSFNPNNVPAQQLYSLNVTVGTSVQDLGIQSQGIGTRGEVQLVATYRLVEIRTGKVLQIGTIHANDSFDIQANGYSTVVAQDDAYTRCVEEARREIVSRLTLFLQGLKTTATS